ncbi:MAG: TlpA family protein disulfide reductase, partial [Planctomycetales bacterium]|nr:TlpA family protein disulfide reductase [Planctomycetales bacterium]
AAQREFTILLQDGNGVALPDMELILSGYGRQADFNALSGASSKLAERWNSEPLGGDVRKTDAEGRLKFHGSEFFSEQAMALVVVAMDTEANRAAISCLYPDARETEITLTMQALREIELTIDDAALGIADADNDLSLVVGLAVESSMLFHQKLKGRELVFQIPPGDYKLFATHPLSEPLNISLEVKSDSLVDTAVQISLTLEPNRLTQLIGQDAPVLRDIVAWQGGEPTTLEELRGKVVVLDFWGYWCGPCLAAMPELMKLHDELHEQGLEIIAIHDSSMSSFDALRQQLEPTRNELWNDRELPFRVALAGKGPDEQQTPQGTAIADYGVREFPTTLLIGRDGKVLQRIYPHQADGNLQLIRNLLDQ